MEKLDIHFVELASMYFCSMITIVSATHRHGSATRRVANQMLLLLQEHNLDAQIWDFQELPHDFLFNEMFGKRSAAMEKMIQTYVHEVQHLIWVVPEYNGSFSGVAKLVLDAVPPKIWMDKWCYLVGVASGAAGNLRGQEHLTGIMHYLKMHVHYFKPKLSSIETSFDENGNWLPGRNSDQLSQLALVLKSSV
jgi:chromate reductase